jgi:hypothetical protein
VDYTNRVLRIPANVEGVFAVTYQSTPTTNIVNTRQDIPKNFALYQNYPNPFNPSTTIKFDISKSGYARLDIINMLGQTVATLLDKNIGSGSYSIPWNAIEFPSGIYFCQLRVGDKVLVKKMMLMR